MGISREGSGRECVRIKHSRERRRKRKEMEDFMI
jgi:hypothetical protein